LLRAQYSHTKTLINTPVPLLMGRHNQIDHILTGYGIQVYSMYYLAGELTVILITIRWLQKLGKVWE